MVDLADPGFFGAAWRFSDFCQQLGAGAVYLQSFLKYRQPLSARDRSIEIGSTNRFGPKNRSCRHFSARDEIGALVLRRPMTRK